MLRSTSFATILRCGRRFSLCASLCISLCIGISACKKHSEPVKADASDSAVRDGGTKKAASSEDPLFKIAEKSRKTMDDAKKLEEEMEKAAEAQKKALEAQEKAIEEAK